MSAQIRRERTGYYRILERTQKWAVLGKSSHDTALRDIQALIARGLLKQNEGGGRSTSYSLIVE